MSHYRVRKFWRVKKLGICGENSIERFRKRLGWIVQICAMEANKSSVSKFGTEAFDYGFKNVVFIEVEVVVAMVCPK